MYWKKYVGLGICITVLTLNAGCSSQPSPDESAKGSPVEITMMYPMNLKHFEKLVEDTFPDIDLQVELTTTAAMNGDSERRLRNNHGSDLVVTTLPTGEVKDYVMDVSAEDFAISYQGSVTSPIMIEGQTRYIPLPGQYSGYILNKTLTEQIGKAIPASNAELTEIFAAAQEQGVGMGEDGALFGLSIVSPASVGEYIIGTQVPDFLGLSEGVEWMSDFDAGTAQFNGVWNDSLDLLLEWGEKKYFNAEALSLRTKNATPIMERMLAGTLILSHGNIQMLSDLNDESSDYEFVMLPYLSNKGNEPWITSSPDGYIGINGTLKEEGKEAVLDACMRILGLLSSPEGQEAWMDDTEAMYSYLSNYDSPHDTIPEGIADCAEKGYIYDLQMPSNIIQYFGKCMSSVLDQEIEMKDAMEAMDYYCINGSPEEDYDQSVVGSVTEDLLYENYNTRKEETAIGNLIADAVKEYAQADIAVVNGGGIRASLYKGDVLGADLTAVCPYPNKIITVEAKGSVIAKMLENGISQTVRNDTLPAGRFLQVSGICYAYRPMDGEHAPELTAVTLADGSKLDGEASYTLAITNYMAGSSGYGDNNGDGYTMLNLYSSSLPKAEGLKLLKETDATYSDALKLYFQNHRDEPITAELEGRIVIEDPEYE